MELDPSLSNSTAQSTLLVDLPKCFLPNPQEVTNVAGNNQQRKIAEL